MNFIYNIFACFSILPFVKFFLGNIIIHVCRVCVYVLVCLHVNFYKLLDRNCISSGFMQKNFRKIVLFMNNIYEA